jgi:hypothetical protein
MSYLHSKDGSTPFSPGPLLPESQFIIPRLEQLTQRGWWTVGSQPAVDAAPSEDPIVGWGPKGGYVFQKAFVEFFADSEDVTMLKERVRKRGAGYVSFHAGNLEVHNGHTICVMTFELIVFFRAIMKVMLRTRIRMRLLGVYFRNMRLFNQPLLSARTFCHGRYADQL